MLYLDPTLGNEPSVILMPTPNSADMLFEAGDDSVPRKFAGAHLVVLTDTADIESDSVGSVLRRVGSRFGAIEGQITEISNVGVDDRFVAKALIVESSTLEQVYNQTVNAFMDEDVAINEASEISLHIPLSVNSSVSEESIQNIVGQTIKFDHFAVVTRDNQVTYALEGSDDDVDKYYISSRRSDCDGFAVIRSKDDGLVCCHANKTTAEEAMRKLVENDAEDRPSSLVRLTNGHIESSIDIEDGLDIGAMNFTSQAQPVNADSAEATLNHHEDSESDLSQIAFNSQVPFNFVAADSLGSFPVHGEASARQMAKLANAKPDIEGPAILTGTESGDRRFIHPMTFQNDGMLNTRQLPLPYMFGDVRAQMHLEARLGGWIISVDPVPTDDIGNYALFTRTKLVESEFGQQIFDSFDRGEFRGVSADLDRVRMVELEAGSVVDGGPLNVLIAGRFMGMTAVTFPALEEAGMWLTGDARILQAKDEESALVASGADAGPELQVFSLIEDIEHLFRFNK